MTSVHGRKNAVTRLLADALDDYANGKASLFYWDKEKATTLLRKARVIMPKSSVQIHSGYMASIRDADSTVKKNHKKFGDKKSLCPINRRTQGKENGM